MKIGNTMTVFVVTEPITYKEGNLVPLFDISPAMKYGDIEILTKHNQDMAVSSMSMIPVLRQKLSKFNDEDYILPVGDPVTIAAVAAIAADMNGGYFKMLKWHKGQRKYVVIEINAWEHAY